MGAFTYLFVNILGWFSTFYGFCLFVGLILDLMNSLPFRPKLFIAVWAFIGAGAFTSGWERIISFRAQKP